MLKYEFIELEAGKKYDIRFDYLQNHTEYSIARLVWDKPNNQMMKEAVQLAKNSDVVVLFMGLSPSLEGEEMKVKVEEAFNSFSTNANMKRAANLFRASGATGVPSLVINGQFITSSTMAGNNEAALSTVDYIIANIRAEKAKAAAK